MLKPEIRAEYVRWCELVTDAELAAELQAIAADEEAINDRFYCDLSFGTAGLRGVLGAGTNRMNTYTVCLATQGLADYLTASEAAPTVVIAYDSRNKSDVFAKAAACTLAASGVKVYLMTELQPVPVLSFAVRELGCSAGIMVTASHNPAEYNGYKCYGPDGCQMTDAAADAVTASIRRLDVLTGAKTTDFEAAVAAGTIEMVPLSFVDKFLDTIQKQQVFPEAARDAGLTVIYSPLHGAGNKPVRSILKRIGIEAIVVPEQELPNGDFPTVRYPNPEFKEAFDLARAMSETVDADLLLATDPDCDRVGIAVKNAAGDWVLMTGNEVGCLLLNYILVALKERGELPENPVAVTTVVSSRLASAVAEGNGCEMRLVLTGFKYVGEQIFLLEQAGHPERFMLGFEESYGYLKGGHARDKDAVVASMLICEMAAYYKLQGKSLLDVLNDLYETYGYYCHQVVNVGFAGEQGMKDMAALMERLRTDRPTAFGGKKVTLFTDYRESFSETADGVRAVIHLPSSNVLSFDLEDGAGVIFRPSGTEPKVKAYITATGKTKAEAEALAVVLKDEATAIIKG